MKFVPVSVRVKAAPPAVAVVGLIKVSVGTGLFAALTVKLTEAEVPPPGAGLVTVTGKLPTAVSAVIVPLLEGVKVYHTLFA